MHKKDYRMLARVIRECDIGDNNISKSLFLEKLTQELKRDNLSFSTEKFIKEIERCRTGE